MHINSLKLNKKLPGAEETAFLIRTKFTLSSFQRGSVSFHASFHVLSGYNKMMLKSEPQTHDSFSSCVYLLPIVPEFYQSFGQDSQNFTAPRSLFVSLAWSSESCKKSSYEQTIIALVSVATAFYLIETQSEIPKASSTQRKRNGSYHEKIYHFRENRGCQ